MTPKERWLAAIKFKQVDHIPFWAKLGGSYNTAQCDPFSSMTINEIHDWVGSDRHESLGTACLKEKRKNTSTKIVKEGIFSTTYYKTMFGELRYINQSDAKSGGAHPVEFPIKTAEDIRIMIEWVSDVQIDQDNESIILLHSKQQQIGQNASTHTNIGTTPMMHFIQHLAGIENAHYLMSDAPDIVEELFDVMHKQNLRRTEILADKHPADMLYLTENTSTTLHTPIQFEKYSFKHIQEYGEILRQKDRIFVLHMCGHLKALLPILAKVKANVFEAFTPPTVGNTKLADGRSACPDKCLVGGTNASMWIQDADTIINRLEKDLSDLPHHRGIVITPAGVMPPLARPETIKKVSNWLKYYKAIM